jgi:acetyl-CoA carboxylase biotin carboxyl carrier protein
MTTTLVLLVATEAGGTVGLRAPKIGVWSDAPAAGTLVGPGSSGGTLRQLGHRFPLRVPDGVSGRVAPRPRRDHAIPVAYGEILFEVERFAATSAGASSVNAVVAARPAGARHLTAPTDGVYYGAPSPGARPFVVPGQRVSAGQTVGLIEVMKTFNPISYGGEGLPKDGEIVAVLVVDGQEVRAGQPLVEVR